MSISPNIPVTNTILDFIKELKKYNTAIDAIKNIFNEDNDLVKTFNIKTRQGFIYELLWDICIKFNITELTDVYEPHNNIHHSIGNFNTISKFKAINDLFDNYLKQKYISGNSGGYSDITFTLKNKDDTTLYLSSAKYFDMSQFIIKYDIQNLCILIKENENIIVQDSSSTKNFKYKEIKTLLFVKDKQQFIKKCKEANRSSNLLIKYISPNGNYENVYDLSDLEEHYKKLCKILTLYNYLKTDDDVKLFKKDYLIIKDKILKPFIPRFHQELFIEKINNLIRNNIKQILVGAIPRSGKTYIMAGTILKDVVSNTKAGIYNNYILISPAPTETLEQYKEVFNDHIDFKRNNIEIVDVKSKKGFKTTNPNKHYVFIVSKQLLGFHTKDPTDPTEEYKEKDFISKDLVFKIMFFDEAHFAMTTTKSQDIYDSLDNLKISNKIFVTATYTKPSNVFNIKHILMWGIEDINFIKRYDEKNIDKFKQYFYKKFDDNIVDTVLAKYNDITKIIKSYNHFPEPFLLTSVWDKEFLDNQKKLILGTNYGFDMDKLFTYRNDKITFENEWDLKELFEYYIGYPLETKRQNISYIRFEIIDKSSIDVKSKLKNSGSFQCSDNIKEILDKDITHRFKDTEEENFKYLLENQNIYYKKDDDFYKPFIKYKTTKRDYNEIGFYKKRGIMPRIRDICTNECRTLQHIKHKTSQLWFLPGGTQGRLLDYIVFSLIYFLSNHFKLFFESHMFFICRTEQEIKSDKKQSEKETILEDFKLKQYPNVILQTATDNNIKTQIKAQEDLIINNEKYRGLIILTGHKLQLGVSLPNVDIVTLFTNSMSSDSIFQMLFRSMTEVNKEIECNDYSFCAQKKYGFMVDLKPQRVLLTLNNINQKLNKEQQDKTSSEYIPIADLINIDKDIFINKYDYAKNKAKIKEDIIDYSKVYIDKLLENNDYTNEKDINTIFKLYDFELKNIDANLLKYLKILRLDAVNFNKQITDDAMPVGVKGIKKKGLKDDKGSLGAKESPVAKGSPSPVETATEIETIKRNIKYIIIIILSLLALLQYDNCIINKIIVNNNIKIIEINTLLDGLDKDNKELFINCFKDRIDNILPGKSDEEIFKFIRLIINTIVKIDDDDGTQHTTTGGNLVTLSAIIQSKRKQIYNIKTPDKLLEQINNTLPFSLKAKQERGEVFTPLSLVNEMLDTLPEIVWKNKDLKWLDPATGMGNFPVAIYMRLMIGLENVIIDEEARRKHILTEMLYMVELDKTNVFMINKIFCGKTYKLNIFQGSFIEGGYNPDIFNSKITLKDNIIFMKKIETFASKFDIAIGNPPYNKGGVSKGGGIIWKDFVYKSFYMLNDNGYLLMIHPPGWRKPQSQKASAGDIWKLFKSYNLLKLKIISYPEKITNFPDVDYYLLNKSKNKKKTFIINNKKYYNLYNLPFIPHLINKESISIINKVLDKNGEKFNIIYNQVVKPKKGIKNNSGIPHCHYYDVKINDYQVVFHKYEDNNPDYLINPKIVMTCKSGKEKAKLYAKYISSEIGTTNNTMYQIITHKDNKNNLINFLNSRLINFILKITQYSAPPNYINEFNILNLISKPNEGNIKEQKDIYDYFKLTTEEIKLIEDNTSNF